MAPKELASFMNDYFETLATPLRSHGVDVTEFRADAIMCAWTAEVEEPEIRLNAAFAALDAVEAVSAFSQERDRKLVSRIGLDTGWVYVGHAGGGGHFVYSIVGDAANTAARVESLNKQLGTKILATQAAVEGLDAILLRPLGRFIFVGRQAASPVFEVVAYRDRASEQQLDYCREFSGALEIFEAQRWEEAARQFENYLNRYSDDGPSRLYLERCREFCLQPPALEDPTVIPLDTK